jgi:signal transduction histidine kinase
VALATRHLPAKLAAGLRGYAIALLAVSLGLGAALLLGRHGFKGTEFPPLLLAIAVTVWFTRTGPAILAVLLCVTAFDYFFTEPLYSLYVSLHELPYFLMFVIFSMLISWFTAVRRRAEHSLKESRDRLQNELTERSRHESEITALNAELARRTTDLEAINKELEAFAYTISHDLRAPLRHMAGFTELLQKHAASTMDDRSRRYTAIVLESAQRMGHLVDDLLSFSRIGRTEARNVLVNLQQLVEEAINEVGPEARERDIVWKIGRLPPCYGDRSMLRLAFVNLVSNAVKFTRTRTPAQIQIECVEQDPAHIVIAFRDNGVGFDMKYQNKLFGVFQRLHTQREFEGTGIGLATVRRIVHRHGGEVWADAAVDQGATFFVSLAGPREIER